MALRDVLKKNGYEPTAEPPAASNPSGDNPTITPGSEGAPPATDTPPNNSSDQPPASPTLSEDDISDELLLRALNKKTGRVITSLSDIAQPQETQPTEEELRTRAQEHQNQVRAYALQNKLVTTTDFDQYAQESSVPYDQLTRQLYVRERLEELVQAKTPEDQMPTEQDLETEFDEVNFRFAAETDPKRRAAEKRLQRERDNYIKDKYGKILTLEQQYDQHTTTTQRRQSYNTTVENVFSEVQTELADLDFQVLGDKPEETVTYKFKVKPEEIQAIKKTYLTDNSYQMLSQGEISKDVLKKAIQQGLTSTLMGKIISEVAKAHASSMLEKIGKGRRNIPDRTPISSMNEGSNSTAPGIKRQLEKNKQP